MRQDLNLEQQEEDYKEARKNEIQTIAKSKNISEEDAAQIWDDESSSNES